jgi:hypothetical protein
MLIEGVRQEMQEADSGVYQIDGYQRRSAKNLDSKQFIRHILKDVSAAPPTTDRRRFRYIEPITGIWTIPAS